MITSCRESDSYTPAFANISLHREEGIVAWLEQTTKYMKLSGLPNMAVTWSLAYAYAPVISIGVGLTQFAGRVGPGAKRKGRIRPYAKLGPPGLDTAFGLLDKQTSPQLRKSMEIYNIGNHILPCNAQKTESVTLGNFAMLSGRARVPVQR
jgi:hypothetical protein